MFNLNINSQTELFLMSYNHTIATLKQKKSSSTIHPDILSSIIFEKKVCKHFILFSRNMNSVTVVLCYFLHFVWILYSLIPKALCQVLRHVCWIHNFAATNLFIMLHKHPSNLAVCILICMAVQIPSSCVLIQ